MRTKLILYIGLFFFFGCAEKDGSETKGDFLSVRAVSVAGVLTKASTPVTVGSAGVFLLPNDDYPAVTNCEFQYSSGAWNSSEKIDLISKRAYVCGYYPYNTQISSATSIALSSKEYSVANDFCYATPLPVSSGTPAVSFDMQHAYSKISFNITHGETYQKDCAISEITVSNDSIRQTGNLNITNGSFLSGLIGDVTYKPAITSIVQGGFMETALLLIPVKSISGELTVTFMIDNLPMITNLDLSSLGIASFAAGYNYKVNITVSGTSLIVNSIVVSDWNQQLPIDVNASEYVEPESNCYMVSPDSIIYVPTASINNSSVLSYYDNSHSVSVLWTDRPNPLTPTGTISSLKEHFSQGFVEIKAGSSEGNAIVYIKKSDGTIVWNRHIWVTSYNPDTSADNISTSTVIWMDRNLGATSTIPTSADCFGLFYQWCRETPFPGASGPGSTTARAIYGDITTITYADPNQNYMGPTYYKYFPNKFYKSTSSDRYAEWDTNYSNWTVAGFFVGKDTNDPYSDVWGNSAPTEYRSEFPVASYWGNGSSSAKGTANPCPNGWKVPNNSNWDELTSSNFAWGTNGVDYNSCFFPASGFIGNGGGYSSVGNAGYYWTNNKVQELYQKSDDFGKKYWYRHEGVRRSFSSSGVRPSYGYNHTAFGFSVRCVKVK